MVELRAERPVKSHGPPTRHVKSIRASDESSARIYACALSDEFPRIGRRVMDRTPSRSESPSCALASVLVHRRQGRCGIPAGFAPTKAVTDYVHTTYTTSNCPVATGPTCRHCDGCKPAPGSASSRYTAIQHAPRTRDRLAVLNDAAGYRHEWHRQLPFREPVQAWINSSARWWQAQASFCRRQTEHFA